MRTFVCIFALCALNFADRWAQHLGVPKFEFPGYTILLVAGFVAAMLQDVRQLLREDLH